ncbi:MAG: zinc ribbon domain-containing protein [Armatimonadota bacterium]|nr:zinc ribbon domain-containing protein [Armatimonadota bacterium]
MPIYEFKCKKCDTLFELLCSIGGWDGKECPYCGSKRVSRLLSTFFSRSIGSDGSSHSHGGGCSNCASGACSTCSCH